MWSDLLANGHLPEGIYQIWMMAQISRNNEFHLQAHVYVHCYRIHWTNSIRLFSALFRLQSMKRHEIHLKKEKKTKKPLSLYKYSLNLIPCRCVLAEIQRRREENP